MKIVSLLSMVMIVGILGMAVFFVSNRQTSVGLNVKASPSVTITGTVVSSDPQGCAKNFYLGCYVLFASKGEKYFLVEESVPVNLSTLVGKEVQLTGKVAALKGRDVLMVGSVKSVR